jgi:hypothetical protein
MGWVCVKFVPQLLTDDQRYCLKTITSELFEKSVQNTSSQARLLQEVKVWCLLMTLKPNESHLNGTPHFPHSQRSSACKVELESNADCIFYREGIIHCEFVLEG